MFLVCLLSCRLYLLLLSTVFHTQNKRRKCKPMNNAHAHSRVDVTSVVCLPAKEIFRSHKIAVFFFCCCCCLLLTLPLYTLRLHRIWLPRTRHTQFVCTENFLSTSHTRFQHGDTIVCHSKKKKKWRNTTTDRFRLWHTRYNSCDWLNGI